MDQAVYNYGARNNFFDKNLSIVKDFLYTVYYWKVVYQSTCPVHCTNST